MAEDVVNRAVQEALQKVGAALKIEGKNGVMVSGRFPNFVVSGAPRLEEADGGDWLEINACHLGVAVRQRVIVSSLVLIEDP